MKINLGITPSGDFPTLLGDFCLQRGRIIRQETGFYEARFISKFHVIRILSRMRKILFCHTTTLASKIELVFISQIPRESKSLQYENLQEIPPQNVSGMPNSLKTHTRSSVWSVSTLRPVAETFCRKTLTCRPLAKFLQFWICSDDDLKFRSKHIAKLFWKMLYTGLLHVVKMY